MKVEYSTEDGMKNSYTGDLKNETRASEEGPQMLLLRQTENGLLINANKAVGRSGLLSINKAITAALASEVYSVRLDLTDTLYAHYKIGDVVCEKGRQLWAIGGELRVETGGNREIISLINLSTAGMKWAEGLIIN